MADAHRHAEATAESEGLHAVGEAVGDGLGLFALLGRDVFRRDGEDRRRDGAVHVLVRGEGREQTRVLGEVREDAQFDLVVVRDRQLPSLARHEGVAQTTALFGAHRDVVQVRTVRGESAGARDHLLERRVDATVGLHRVDERRAVGAAQLLDLAVAQDQRDDLVLVLDRLEARGVGRVARLDLLHRRETHLVEEDRLELLGRVDLELVTGDLLDLLVERGRLLGELLGDRAQEFDVDADAARLHQSPSTITSGSSTSS